LGAADFVAAAAAGTPATRPIDAARQKKRRQTGRTLGIAGLSREVVGMILKDSLLHGKRGIQSTELLMAVKKGGRIRPSGGFSTALADKEE